MSDKLWDNQLPSFFVCMGGEIVEGDNECCHGISSHIWDVPHPVHFHRTRLGLSA